MKSILAAEVTKGAADEHLIGSFEVAVAAVSACGADAVDGG